MLYNRQVPTAQGRYWVAVCYQHFVPNGTNVIREGEAPADPYARNTALLIRRAVNKRYSDPIDHVQKQHHTPNRVPRERHPPVCEIASPKSSEEGPLQQAFQQQSHLSHFTHVIDVVLDRDVHDQRSLVADFT